MTKRWDSQAIWLDLLLRPWVLAAMVGSVVASLAKLLALLGVEGGTYLLFSGVFGTLAGAYVYHLTRTFVPSAHDRRNFRLLALVVAFPLLKAVGYVGQPFAVVRADVRSWFVRPYLFFDTRTFTAFVFFLIGWVVALKTVADFERIGLPSEDKEEVLPLKTLRGRFFVGGVLLMLFSGVARLGVAELLNMQRPPVPGLIFNVLLYFLLGLILMGQTHLTVLLVRWREQHVRIARGLTGRWVWYSLVFFSLVTLIAFLLPTGYTLPLLDLFAWLFWILGLIAWFFGLLLQLLLLPFLWLFERLFGADVPQPDLSSLPAPEMVPQAASQDGGGPSWFVFLRSLVFWGVLVGILVSLIRTYLQEHPALVSAITQLGVVKVVQEWLRTFWRWLRGATTAIVERLPRRLRPGGRRTAGATRGAESASRRADTVRARVLSTYLETLADARRAGVPRRDTQTPEEYRGTLSPEIPEAVPQVDELTAAFIEARYSQHPLTREDVARARADAEQVRQALLARQRRRQQAAERSSVDERDSDV